MEKREELYYILKEYLSNHYTTAVFADVMFSAFYPDRPIEELSEPEFSEFNKLAEAVSRFSKYEEDFINCPNAFVSSEELLMTARQVYENLTRDSSIPQNIVEGYSSQHVEDSFEG